MVNRAGENLLDNLLNSGVVPMQNRYQRKGQFMNFSTRGIPELKFTCESCLFSWRKRNTRVQQKWAKFMNFRGFRPFLWQFAFARGQDSCHLDCPARKQLPELYNRTKSPQEELWGGCHCELEFPSGNPLEIGHFHSLDPYTKPFEQLINRPPPPPKLTDNYYSN